MSKEESDEFAGTDRPRPAGDARQRKSIYYFKKEMQYETRK